MNLNTYEQSDLHLPEPIAYQNKAKKEQGVSAATPEALPELHAQMVPLTPLVPAPPVSAAQPTIPQIPAPATNSHASAALTADDSDLIEKEWVEKAKAIVNQTKEDPHIQSAKMSQVKAEYMKKRYNKDIKLNTT